MRLATYSHFGSLRLRKWRPDYEFLEDENLHYQLISETVRGISFLRSTEQPDETFQIHLDLFDCLQDVCAAVLKEIQFPAIPGATPENVIALFGEPENCKRFRRHGYSWYEFKSEGPERYSIVCTFLDGKGLSSICVSRLDIPFPKSQEEMDSAPSTHQRLDEFEVLPTNIKSPESPLLKVALPMESTGSFRFIIRTRPQLNVKVEAATLMIRHQSPSKGHSIFHLRLDRTTAEGVLEVTGHIEKELLFRTFVEFQMRDDVHDTSQTVVVEFDQWYGKNVK